MKLKHAPFRRHVPQFEVGASSACQGDLLSLGKHCNCVKLFCPIACCLFLAMVMP